MTELTGMVGFASPNTEKRFSRRRNLGVELLATVALAISLVIAATAVSIGMARAPDAARAMFFGARVDGEVCQVGCLIDGAWAGPGCLPGSAQIQ